MVRRSGVRGAAWSAAFVALLSLTFSVAARDATLVDAVKARDVVTVKRLLGERPDVNVAEADGTTALHWAAEYGDRQLVDVLLRAGADARLATRYGVTPLHLAATSGTAQIVEALLRAGADPNAPLPSGETPLMQAARTGGADVIQTLVTHGADVNVRERQKGQTALMWAAAHNNVGAIRALVEAGADPNATSEGRFTAYLFAVRGGHVDAARTLVQLGVDVDQALPDGMSALVLAVYNAHYELAAALIELGADPNASGQGWTALHQVAWSRRPNRGFNLPGAVPTGGLDSLDLVRTLVARGADVNARMTKEPRDGNRNMLNRIGSTPFLMAAKSADVPLMRTLLDLGADPTLTNDDGTTALMVAAGVGVYGPGESPGTHEEALEAVKLAFEVGGGDVNDIDANGETALHGAVYRGGAVPVIRFLAERGARLDVENKKQWTPLFAAEGVVYASSGIRRYPEAAALLRDLMMGRGLDVDAEGRVRRDADDTTSAVADTTSAVAVAQGRSNWDGVFSEAQAKRGQEVYARACAVCHLDSLMGDAVSPTLVGPAFTERWNGTTVHDMVESIRSSMPQNAPDSLGDEGYVDLIAYLLHMNGSPTGDGELQTDVNALRSIEISSEPPRR